MATRIPSVKVKLLQGADMALEWRRVFEDWQNTFQKLETLYKKLNDLADGKAAPAGTKTPTLGSAAPIDGPPSKWIAVDDDGTTRFLPLW